MTAVSDETGRGWLPLKYEDGPDFCTVTFATGAAFALTVHPERMKLMEAALSAATVGEPALRMCGYCKTWNSKPCGEQCYLQPSDPVWTAPVAQEPVAYQWRFRPEPAMTADSDETGREAIKPLEWQGTFIDRGDGSQDQAGWEADTGFGVWYEIEQYFGSDSYGYRVSFDYEMIGDHDDPGQAKATAQKHFEKRIRAALSASPVAQESQLLTLLDAATVALQGLIERPGDDDSWGEANKLLPKLLSRLERRGDECCAHGVELHQDCYRCDEGPVAQEPVASDDPYFIMLWNWFEKRRGKEDMRAIQNDGGLSVDDLETMLDEHEADLLSQINTPPAPSAGVGADEIAQIIATKCFDPRVIDSSGKPFWKKSQWREAQQAANAILLLLSGGGSEVTHLRMPTQQQNI